MSQKTFKKIQTSNVPSIYSNQQNRKQHLKRGALESRVKGSHVATTVTNPTNPSVASNGVPPSQGSNTNIKYTVQSQMQLAHQQKLYQGGGITSVGSASSIGDKIEKIEDKPIKGKTRQHSQNKSATRGKSSHIASREMIVDSRANNPTSNNGTQMR